MTLSDSRKGQIIINLGTYHSAFRLPQLFEKDYYAAEEFLDHVTYHLSVLNASVVDKYDAPETVREIAEHFDLSSLVYSLVFENEKMRSYSVWTLIDSFADDDAEFLKEHVVDGFYIIKPLKAGGWMLLTADVEVYGALKILK